MEIDRYGVGCLHVGFKEKKTEVPEGFAIKGQEEQDEPTHRRAVITSFADPLPHPPFALPRVDLSSPLSTTPDFNREDFRFQWIWEIPNFKQRQIWIAAIWSLVSKVMEDWVDRREEVDEVGWGSLGYGEGEAFLVLFYLFILIG